MDNIYLELIDPAFKNVKHICRLELTTYFEGLSYNEKRDFGIVDFQPVVPRNAEEVEEAISGHIDIYAVETPENAEEMKQELIQYCERINLNLDVNLPLIEFKTAMRNALHRLSNDKLLEVGIFGYPVSEEDVVQKKEELISWYLMALKQAAYEELLIEMGKGDPEVSNWNHQEISSKFPSLVHLIKENVSRRNLLN